MNLGLAKTRVIRNLEPKDIPPDLLVDTLNRAWEEIALRRGGIKRCITTSVTINQPLYRINVSNLIKMDKVSIFDGATEYELDEIPGSFLERSAPGDLAETGFPPKWWSVFNRSGVYYVRLRVTPNRTITNDPDNGIDDGLWLWMTKNHTPIYNDTDEPEIIPTFQDAGIELACWKLTHDKIWWLEYERLYNLAKEAVPQIEVAIKERISL